MEYAMKDRRYCGKVF